MLDTAGTALLHNQSLQLACCSAIVLGVNTVCENSIASMDDSEIVLQDLKTLWCTRLSPAHAMCGITALHLTRRHSLPGCLSACQAAANCPAPDAPMILQSLSPLPYPAAACICHCCPDVHSSGGMLEKYIGPTAADAAASST